MTDHFNGLTPGEAERLAMLAEEAAEVVQLVGKILRHGYESYHPKDPAKTSNRRLLHGELTDMIAVHCAMIAEKDLPLVNRDDIPAIWERKKRFTHHQ